MIYRSLYTKEELTARWDDLTAPARFAGADDRLDWVFNASRKDDKVRLVRKPKLSYDPFAAVFHGTIKKDGDISFIDGYYSKSLIDYIIVAAISIVYFGVCFEYLSRSESPLSPLILIFLGLAVVAAVLTTFPPTRKRYAALITKVTGAPSAEAVKNLSDKKAVADKSTDDIKNIRNDKSISDGKSDTDENAGKDKKPAGDEAPAKAKYKFRL